MMIVRNPKITDPLIFFSVRVSEPFDWPIGSSSSSSVEKKHTSTELSSSSPFDGLLLLFGLAESFCVWIDLVPFFFFFFKDRSSCCYEEKGERRGREKLTEAKSKYIKRRRRTRLCVCCIYRKYPS